jgi:hypothetical protein
MMETLSMSCLLQDARLSEIKLLLLLLRSRREPQATHRPLPKQTTECVERDVWTCQTYLRPIQGNPTT